MSKRRQRPALVPELYVRDIDASVNFYTSALGFQTEYARIEERFACLSRGDAWIMLEQPESFTKATAAEVEQGRWMPEAMSVPFGRGVNFEILVDDYDQLIDSARSFGVQFLLESQDKVHTIGAEEISVCRSVVVDPDGYLLRFYKLT